MSRKILFRGKRIDNGEWVEGIAFPHDSNQCSILYQHPADGSLVGTEVAPSTVGQYTGLTDKNGKKIFEGDVLTDGNTKYLVRYSPCSTGFQAEGFCRGGIWSLYHLCNKRNQGRRIWIIGNIHDNHELLEATPCTE